MSSAILYLAIVAIWACVLIPRWLRRDSARTAGSAAAQAPAFDGLAETADDSTYTVADADRADEPLSETVVLVASADDADLEPAPLPAPLSAQESRRRMLTARRRLLGMLITLEAAAIALAVVGLAALWVIIPPTIMLAGYLLLLREAAAADAEYAQREAEAAAAAAAQAKERARARREAKEREARERTVRQPAPAEEAPLAARFAFAAAPVPADYEDSGRDFAPGLAGKYTPANADPELADEDPYGYELPRLRAVGD